MIDAKSRTMTTARDCSVRMAQGVAGEEHLHADENENRREPVVQEAEELQHAGECEIQARSPRIGKDV